MRSSMGTIFFLTGGLVHFSSSLQRITASSTTKAELLALSYLFNLLRELGWSSIRPRTISFDPQVDLRLSSKSNYRKASKHLAISFYRLKGLINS
ncbi:unnamed protein product, partial [Sphacelaria rigidula]